MFAAAEIDVSAGGLVLGILVGALVFLVVKLVLDHVEGAARYSTAVALVLAAIVFFVLGFDVYDS